MSTDWDCPTLPTCRQYAVQVPKPERPGFSDWPDAGGPTIETAALLLIPCLMVALALKVVRR